MLINQIIPSFYGGVSEQPDEFKLDNQCDTMENCIPSPASGLQRRLPARIISEIDESEGLNGSSPYIYTYFDGSDEFIMLFYSGYWKVFNSKGELITDSTIDGDNNLDYLICKNPSKDLEAITIKDNTYILNKTKKTQVEILDSDDITVSSEYIYRIYIDSLNINKEHIETNRDIEYGNYYWGAIGRFKCILTINGNIYNGYSNYKASFTTVYHNDSYYEEKLRGFRALDEAISNSELDGFIWDNRTLNATTPTTITINFEWIKITQLEYEDMITYIPSDLYNAGLTNPKLESSIKNDYDYGKNDDSILYNTVDNTTWKEKYYYWIKQTTNPGYNYNIVNGSILLSSVTGDNSNTIINSMKTDLENGGYNITKKGSVIRLDEIDYETSNLGFSDSFGDQASYGFGYDVPSINELPSNLGLNGSIFKINGDVNDDYDNYYVVYQNGIYKEIAEPQSAYRPLATTMPHKLIRGFKSDGFTPRFYFTPNNGTIIIDEANNTLQSFEDTWGFRKSGDKINNPDPSFIGKTIESIFFYKERLGFLSGDNIILSETKNFYNFYFKSMIDILSTDKIDNKVDTYSKLRSVIVYQKDLLLFGDNEQFILSSNGELTSKTINVQKTTSFKYNNLGKPFALGPNVYFTENKDYFSKVREYYVQPDTIINDANDISSHIPTYIPNNVKKIVGSTKFDMLFLISEKDDKSIYVYNYAWEGNTKIQSAWHKWTFKEKILEISILEKRLIILFQGPTSQTLKTINLEIPADFNNVEYADHIGSIPGEGEIFSFYDSNFTFSKWTIKKGTYGIGDFRNLLKMKNVELSSDLGSYYDTSIYHRTREKVLNNKEILNDSSKNNRFGMQGNSTDLSIIIHSIQDKGFKLNSAVFVGNYTSKSKGI